MDVWGEHAFAQYRALRSAHYHPAPPLIVMILMVCNNRRVMGEQVNGRLLNLFGTGAALVMIIAAVAMFLN